MLRTAFMFLLLCVPLSASTIHLEPGSKLTLQTISNKMPTGDPVDVLLNGTVDVFGSSIVGGVVTTVPGESVSHLGTIGWSGSNINPGNIDEILGHLGTFDTSDSLLAGYEPLTPQILINSLDPPSVSEEWVTLPVDYTIRFLEEPTIVDLHVSGRLNAHTVGEPSGNVLGMSMLTSLLFFIPTLRQYME